MRRCQENPRGSTEGRAVKGYELMLRIGERHKYGLKGNQDVNRDLHCIPSSAPISHGVMQGPNAGGGAVDA